MYTGNYIFLVLVVVLCVGYFKIFEKLGKPGWKALVPFYNFYEIYKLLEKPWWWMFLMIVPGVNIIMFGVIGYHTACYFGKRKTNDLLFAAILPYLYIFYLGFSKNEKWTGVEDLKKQQGGFVRNWLDPLLFAVVAATVIRSFFLEAFTIPTSSLEKSLMVGDFLFVNKFAYGAKVPQTPLAFPFAHHTLPFTKDTKSYLEWIKLPYMRLPGYSKIKNYDIVVFNYPDGDTVALGAQNQSYYDLVREHGYQNIHNPNYTTYRSPEPVGEVVARPVDKREHYVKRCVAIAGDNFEIKDGEIYINDKPMPMPPNAQHFYEVKTSGSVFGMYDGQTVNMNAKLLDKFDIYIDEAYMTDQRGDTSIYMLNMPENVATKIKTIPGFISMKKIIAPKGQADPRIFPHNPNYVWNNDNFGPFVIPKQGASVKINPSNICLYDRVIGVYDGNKLEQKDGKIFINGVESTEYTFKQDYYFMMGDNRHNSADSRCWGLVPFDHVVGKPVFVWFSMKDKEKNPISGASVLGSLFKNSKDGKFRWERFMCVVGDDGLSKSYFVHFLVLIALFWGGNKMYIRYKQKKAKT